MTGGGTFMHYAGKKAPPDQAERRADLRIKDTHGRSYHVIYDKVAGCVIRAQALFHAPWMPDDLVVSNSIVTEGGYPRSIAFDYPALLKENRLQWMRYFDDLRTIGARMNGIDHTKAYEAATQGRWEEVPRALLMELGIPPEPEDFIKAAMAGNKWVLGLTQEPPAWVLPIVGLRDLFRSKAEIPFEESELDKYRDVEEDADPEALGGVVVPVAAPRKGRPPKAQKVTFDG